MSCNRNTTWATSVFLNMLENTMKQKHKDPEFPNSTYDQGNVYEATPQPSLSYCNLEKWHVVWKHTLWLTVTMFPVVDSCLWLGIEIRDWGHLYKNMMRLSRRSHPSEGSGFPENPAEMGELRRKTLVWSRSGSQSCREQELRGKWKEAGRQMAVFWVRTSA